LLLLGCGTALLYVLLLWIGERDRLRTEARALLAGPST
jgi:hypothetical protein